MVKNGKISLTDNEHKGGAKLPLHKKDICFSFSFRFFKQIEYFGLGQEKTKWFISLIDRLTDLCKQDSSLLGNYNDKSTYRIHEIEWGQKNIPLQRADLNWIPKEYLNNDKEFPIIQIELSTGKGRIIGFFNENSTIFYIVLLDPLHNMQPCRSRGYKIHETQFGDSEYNDTLRQIASHRNKFYENCKHNKGNCLYDSFFPPTKGGYIYIDEDFVDKYNELLENGTFTDKFERFLLEDM